MCGKNYPLPDAVHIVDEKEWKKELGEDDKINGIPLCPNCHRVFDEVFRPYLFRALKKFGTNNLPTCWSRNNKISVIEQDIGLDNDEY
jgi:predicted restriction endonuclease